MTRPSHLHAVPDAYPRLPLSLDDIDNILLCDLEPEDLAELRAIAAKAIEGHPYAAHPSTLYEAMLTELAITWREARDGRP